MNLKEKQKKKSSKSYFVYNFVKITGSIPILLWMRPKVINTGSRKLSEIGGMMLCVNHESMTDPVLVLSAFTRTKLIFLATKDLFTTKFKKFFFKQLHCITVDKDNVSMDIVHDVCDELKNNNTIVIFPEGQIDRTGKHNLLEFKSGVIFMASIAKAEILPAYLVPKKKWYNRRVVVVGEPVNVKELCGPFPNTQQMQEGSEALRDKVLELRDLYIRNEKVKANKKNKC